MKPGTHDSWVVRVVTRADPNELPPSIQLNGAFLELLDRCNSIQLRRDGLDPGAICFDIPCPTFDFNSKAWAEAMAERFEALGFHAVPSPAMPEKGA